ncbi:hypothetical protein EFK50_09495 [Nocardioides marmoriginsengisoli]|uniref:Uncharacterized protein n=1 Tax=Nocardioides marmoriginsengisoli TaxID=661483 RepID=A0A3N0CF16_9ACTN|nr:hypothetical protein [Nocardioides marmoriginsengisoli]RNL62050.1 hypothetical protein EFK50_09495 [Nocardioides marmoriginsengisoli]
METSPARPTPEEAAAVLRDAEESRDRLAEDLVLPPYFHASIGASIVAQIVTGAVGIARQDGAGMRLVVLGLVVFYAVGAAQLFAFRRRNGVWLGGLMSRVVFGTATLASTVYALAFGAAVWAAFADLWWVVAICAVVGGAGYVVSGVRWMRTYRSDPARHGRGESLLMVVLLVLSSVVLGVLLVIGS